MNTEIIEMKEKKETFKAPLLPLAVKVPAKLIAEDIMTIEEQNKAYRASRVERAIKKLIAVKFVGENK